LIKHIHKHLFIYLLSVPFLIFSIFLPDTTITLNGGFAWAYMYCLTYVALVLIWVGISGGEVIYSSRGLMGWIKALKEEHQRKTEEIEKLRQQIIKENPRYVGRLIEFDLLSNRRLKWLIKDMKKQNQRKTP
jgi:hypothetical protein